MKKNTRVYIAYGSNMDVGQMEHRCPNAHILAKGFLKDYSLEFCGNMKGNNYATVIKKTDSKVPILLWETSADDEHWLDVYEGYPSFYRKESISADEIEITEVFDFIKLKDAYIYIMNSDILGPPTVGYFKVIRNAYFRFGFDTEILNEALKRSTGRKFVDKRYIINC